MKKTGESYTAARQQLLRKKAAIDRPESVVATPPDLPALAGMSDAAVRKATGKT